MTIVAMLSSTLCNESPRAADNSRGVVNTWMRGIDVVTVSPSGRACMMCGAWKPAECFSVNAGRLRSRCKPCRASVQNRSYYDDRERILEGQKAYAATRKAAKSEYDRQYREQNADNIRRRMRTAYYQKKSAGIKPKPMTDAQKAARRSYYAARYLVLADQIKARTATYRRSNKEKNRAWQQAYRSKRRNGDGVTAAEWIAVLDRYGWQCLACGATDLITMDHIVPLSRGGRHEPSNIQPLCKSCNSRKRARTIDYRPDVVQGVG